LSKNEDWRSRPRKPGKLKLTKRLSIRVTEEELDLLHVKAEAAGLPLSDFVIRSCLGRSAR